MFTVVGMYLIDTAGRKKLMAVGSGLMVLFALGISFSYANNYQLLMLIFVMCFTSCFAFSMGPIPWIMIPELFPTYLRGRATADLKQAEADIKAAEAELARARPCQGACHRHQGRSRSAGQRAEAALIPSCLLALCE